jgi:hypothetical protein
MQLTITQADLEKGIINSPTSDAVALAAQRAGLVRPLVGRTHISFDHGPTRQRVEMPIELKKFIAKLSYGERHEMLKMKRGRKEGQYHHEAAVFTLPLERVRLDESTIGPALKEAA